MIAMLTPGTALEWYFNCWKSCSFTEVLASVVDTVAKVDRTLRLGIMERCPHWLQAKHSRQPLLHNSYPLSLVHKLWDSRKSTLFIEHDWRTLLVGDFPLRLWPRYELKPAWGCNTKVHASTCPQNYLNDLNPAATLKEHVSRVCPAFKALSVNDRSCKFRWWGTTKLAISTVSYPIDVLFSLGMKLPMSNATLLTRCMQ